MNKFVLNVFKTIMFAIIFVFVLDIAFYLYRAFSLNQRMNSIMTSMQKVVMENNYLTDRDKTTYEAIFTQLVQDYNGSTEYASSRGNARYNGTWAATNASGRFIKGIRWNYGTDAKLDNMVTSSITAKDYTNSNTTLTTRNILKKDMSDTSANYGDIMVVQVQVDIVQPLYDLLNGSYVYQSTSVLNRRVKNNTITYTYYVPCQHYQVTNDV